VRPLAASALLVVILVAGADAQDSAGRPVPEGRGALTIPGEVWDGVLAGLERTRRPLGYTAEEMAHYGGRKHLLRTVENLFRDVRAIPRYSGRLAESLVKAAPRPAEVVRIAYNLTDAVAGRQAPLPPLDNWGGGATDAGAEAALIALLKTRGISVPSHHPDGHLNLKIVPDFTEDQRVAFRLLPPAARRLIVRLVAAIRDEAPWIAKAFPEGLPASDPKTSRRSIYDFATATLSDERLGQLATTRRDAFEALDKLDRDYLAFGSVLLLARISQALDEYESAEKARAIPKEFTGLTLNTRIGTVRIYGTGNDQIEEPAILSLDLGGSDTWTGRHAVPTRDGLPVGVAIDLAGNDTWDGGDEPASLACGLFGVGALFDLSGDDVYRCWESGLGCGWFGTGVLVDFSGNDRYETATHWGQGMGYAGVGALIDLAGNDEYVIGYDGQAYGATLGAGVLVDVSGDDSYLARDDGNISALYKGQSVSMAQGVGQGRRADLGDGHSLAGGFGVLVDGAGDDRYHATCWSHGAGYWWAVGILEDLGGNDTYRDGKYSLGAGAHFAIGVCSDLSGDDAYNVGYAAAVNQYQGHARDGSIGVFLDGDGDDRYQLRAHCGGSGDLASIGLFWDRRGDDLYEITAVSQGKGGNWGATPPLGSSTFYAPMRSYRDDLDTAGVFLDTGGKDEYRGPDGPWANDREWPTERGPRFRGYGRDLAWFAPDSTR